MGIYDTEEYLPDICDISVHLLNTKLAFKVTFKGHKLNSNDVNLQVQWLFECCHYLSA